MTAPLVTPKTLATGTNNPASQISKNVWNAGHNIVLNAAGDLIVGGAAGAAELLPKGTEGQVLKVVSGAVAWGTDATSDPGAGMVNPMTTAEDLIVGGTAGAPARLGKGTDGQVLKVVAGAIAWGTDNSGGAGGLTLETGTDAATTMVSGKEYVVDMSAWATADRIYKLPTCSAGDAAAILITAGNASYELIVQGDTGVTLNGVSAAEWSRLFITGERLSFKATGTNTWMVDYDGRIPCKTIARLTTASTTDTGGTLRIPTDGGGAWTVDKNIGDCFTAADGKFTARRAVYTQSIARAGSNNNIADTKYYEVAITDGTTTTTNRDNVGGSVTALTALSGFFSLATGGYVQLKYRGTDNNVGMASGHFQVIEAF